MKCTAARFATIRGEGKGQLDILGIGRGDVRSRLAYRFC